MARKQLARFKEAEEWCYHRTFSGRHQRHCDKGMCTCPTVTRYDTGTRVNKAELRRRMRSLGFEEENHDPQTR